jgi:glycosyltransferase involved in cell wall biosynthesis
VSDLDAEFTNNHLHIYNTLVINNGVDSAYFSDNKGQRDLSSLLFVGNFNNVSNEISIKHFVENIFPAIKIKYPNVKLYVVGPNANFSFNDSNIIMTGYVDDVREYYHKCGIFISPLISGSGLKNKILEAMSASIPVVTSNIGNDGINAKDREQIMLANSKDEWLSAISELFESKELYNRVINNALDYVSTNYSWSTKLNEYYSAFIKTITK